MKTTTANPVTSEMSHSRTTFMVKLALMVAIIFVMAFSPLGYLRTPGLTITFLTVPVAVGAIILGPTAGAICGGAFGLTSAIMALTGGSAFSAALLQINPFGLLFTVLVPRILEGWLCGLIFAALKKVFKMCIRDSSLTDALRTGRSAVQSQIPLMEWNSVLLGHVHRK